MTGTTLVLDVAPFAGLRTLARSQVSDPTLLGYDRNLSSTIPYVSHYQ
ncbi:hypothetical protein SAMN04488498_1653 [Mesorhizobium albiziae]|uniref:Uncharacterized protein n=1 Tax=Neomesorhizobium albiziae TaxID=335020 RepID=A0A1I4FX41_9HYPH|nr:hypothetical protein SAMN04488498_1653 [Mesorhizobium albiziae]